jgi:hypothetical protein
MLVKNSGNAVDAAALWLAPVRSRRVRSMGRYYVAQARLPVSGHCACRVRAGGARESAQPVTVVRDGLWVNASVTTSGAFRGSYSLCRTVRAAIAANAWTELSKLKVNPNGPEIAAKVSGVRRNRHSLLPRQWSIRSPSLRQWGRSASEQERRRCVPR